MDIVLEGPDGGGKSTLARHLSQALDMPVQPSEGPPKYKGEINKRIERYLSYDRPYIFDRHPVISQTIYNQIRVGDDPELVSPSLAALFGAKPSIFVYVRAPSFARHVIKPHDTARHLKQISDNYQLLVEMYDKWALATAEIVYRIPQPMTPIIHYYLAAADLATLVPDGH